MENKKENQPENKKKLPDKFRAFATYSNIAFAFVGAALLGYFIGSLLDRYFATEKPIWTGVMVALLTLLYLAKVIIELIRS
jgi:F0F1-type ATP synthase assembly protein I